MLSEKDVKRNKQGISSPQRSSNTWGRWQAKINASKVKLIVPDMPYIVVFAKEEKLSLAPKGF